MISPRLYQYADDTVILSRHSRFPEAVSLLQDSTINLMNWFANNVINVNVSKTQLICFHNPLKKVSLSVPLLAHCSSCSQCSCAPVPYVSSVKYLGVLLDSDFTWNSHLAYVCSRLRAVSRTLYTIRYYTPLSVRKMILQALGYSVLRYGITTFGHCANRWKNRINSILLSILKVISYDLRLPSGTDLFKSLRCSNFDALLTETAVLRHFWSNKYKVPYVPTRCLRPKNRFRVIGCSTRYGQRTRSYFIPSCFNQLPPSVFRAKTKFKLKQLLRRIHL